MFHEHLNTTDDALSAVGFVAPLTGAHSVKFNVLEDEMLIEIGFQGVILGAGIGVSLAELGFEIDGGAVLLAEKLWGSTIVAAELTPVSFSRKYRLARGEHTVVLFGGADAGAPVLNGATYPSRMTIEKVTNTNVVAANDNVKRQGAF